jgi:hypothetical protein
LDGPSLDLPPPTGVQHRLDEAPVCEQPSDPGAARCEAARAAGKASDRNENVVTLNPANGAEGQRQIAPGLIRKSRNVVVAATALSGKRLLPLAI